MEPIATPIADYGLVGDTRTAALVSSDGSLDWFCIPRFDGEPVFGRLVGGTAAGRFRLGPAAPSPVTNRRYRGHSATLETTWETPQGTLTLTEGMVAEVAGSLLPATLLVRRLSADGGTCEALVEFDPRLGDAHRHPRVSRRGELVICEWGTVATSLRSDAQTDIEPGKPTVIVVAPGLPVTFVVAVAHREPLIDVEPTAAWSLLLHDEQRWHAWAAAIAEDLPFRDAVVRSLITLRLLTYSPTGAPVAAPTTSLPEHRGGIRNWDYRLAWPRDASIGIAAFLKVGMVDEARGFLWWLLHASRLDRPRLPVLLTLDGRRSPAERTLRDWPGYASSPPVRVGNGAANQHQLDGYGWVVDAAWAFVQAGHPLYAETWRAVCGFADLVARRWSDPDAGIWEVRGGRCAPRPLQADGMARAGPSPAHRAVTPHLGSTAAPLGTRACRPRRRYTGTRLRQPSGHLHPQLRIQGPRRCAACPPTHRTGLTRFGAGPRNDRCHTPGSDCPRPPALPISPRT